MSDTIVITGINSFLGYHLARAFAAAGYRVVGTYRTPPERLGLIQHVRWERVQDSLWAAEPLDVTDRDAVRALVRSRRPRLWIHQAGLGKDFASESYDLAEANRMNLASLDAIYPAMAEAGGSVVATGSGMEYGAAECPHREDAACWPQSPYGLAKLAATLRARQLAHLHRVPTRIPRIYTVFGELDGPDRLVTRLIRRLRGNGRMGIAPGVARDICDVADLATGYLHLAIDCLCGPLFEIFNLSRGTAMPLSDFARIVARQLGLPGDLIFEDPLMLRPGEPLVLCGDSRKASTQLGWSARPVAEGLARLTLDRAPAYEAMG